MIFDKGYTARRVKTSHGTDIYLAKFGNIVKVVPCNPKKNLSYAYVNNLIRQIESDS
jgi:hypothetical protein